jgi:uncharacterized protein (TIGR02266 family)
MGDPDSFSDELGSIFEEPEPEPELEAELSTRSDLPALVAEFVPLNRRRVCGEPPLSVAEIERWVELREWLEYELGSSNPPLAGTHRRTLRVPTHLKVRTAGRGEAVSNLRNVSEGGAFVEMAEPLEPGTPLALEIDPGNGESPLRLGAVVRWNREIGNMDGPAGVGIEFQNVEDGDFAALERLVDHVLGALQRGGS